MSSVVRWFVVVVLTVHGLIHLMGQERRGRVASPGNPNWVRTPGLNAT